MADSATVDSELLMWKNPVKIGAVVGCLNIIFFIVVYLGGSLVPIFCNLFTLAIFVGGVVKFAAPQGTTKAPAPVEAEAPLAPAAPAAAAAAADAEVPAEAPAPVEAEAPSVPAAPAAAAAADAEVPEEAEAVQERPVAQVFHPNGVTKVELVAALASLYGARTATARWAHEGTCFHAAANEPRVGVYAYLDRLRTYCECSEAVFVMSLVYLDRLVNLHDFEVSARTIRKLLAAALVVSVKLLECKACDNAYYAKVCGLHTKELNILEVELMRMLHWRLHVSADEFDGYCQHVLRAAACVRALATAATAEAVQERPGGQSERQAAIAQVFNQDGDTNVELVAALASFYEAKTVTARGADEATCFHAKGKPPVSVYGYLQRLCKFCRCSKAVLVASLVYLDRLVNLPDFEVSTQTIHRLLAAALVVSVKVVECEKFVDGKPRDNAYYAKVCGLPTKELNKLETALIRMLDGRLHVSADEFDGYCQHVLRMVRLLA